MRQTAAHAAQTVAREVLAHLLERRAIAHVRRREQRLDRGAGTAEAHEVGRGRLGDRDHRRERRERRDGGLALALAPAAGALEAVLGTVAASFAAVLAHGETGRIKRCANPDCRWVIYDTSRNGARRWCEERVCGSLMRVRRLRARRRPAPE